MTVLTTGIIIVYFNLQHINQMGVILCYTNVKFTIIVEEVRCTIVVQRLTPIGVGEKFTFYLFMGFILCTRFSFIKSIYVTDCTPCQL
jgi:hypothetical protein